ncbi:MAG: S9 family peptidase [Bacteroidetes bacterium]|nr:MAG: S9 family peptidase [Bacteroidota bacterium]
MQKLVWMMTAQLAAGAVLAQQPIQYPETKQGTEVDTYFGVKVADPYRWLEDDNADDTKAWVTAQNKVTDAYLAKIPFRKNIQARLTQLWNYPKIGSPSKHGSFYYFFKNNGLQNQSVLYQQTALNAAAVEFLNPNKFSADGTASLGAISFSKNGKYLAYTVAQSGSDWQEAYIINTANKQVLKEKLSYLKFTGLNWKGDEGFYYSRYPDADDATKLSKKNEYMKVYFHKIGTSQADDQLIYEDTKHPLRNFGAGLSEDETFLFISASEGTSGGEILYKKTANTASGFEVMIEGFATEPDVIDNVGNNVLLKTNDGAPNFKVVLVNPESPSKEQWKTIIPERAQALQSVSTGGGYLFASYLQDASTKVYQYTLEGRLVREIKLPGLGTASGFGGKKEDKEFFYTFTSFNTPATIYKYNIETGVSTFYKKPDVQFNPDLFETKQLFFPSKDGTRVPMFITYKKGLQLNGTNPTMLYGYGGFNIPLTPSFSVSNLFFLEQGGIYAQINLRGGNEYGEDWHKGGMLLNKQNVFNDFIAAAEYLIAEKYTQPSKLAIRGGSNGGLLVGACMAQRPDLFAVAIPQVGVMDMLRYHKFTIGWAWAVEYGNAEKNEPDFKNLFAYSPLHNIKPGNCYPATMVTTADHDDRVVPAHSFKFAAQLQASQSCEKPALIRIEAKAGHGAGKPTSKVIEEATDIWAFVMYNLGMTFKK